MLRGVVTRRSTPSTLEVVCLPTSKMDQSPKDSGSPPTEGNWKWQLQVEIGIHCQAFKKELFDQLKKVSYYAFPDLFSGRYQIVTEMGGSLIQKAGKTLVRIETVSFNGYFLPAFN